MDELLGEERVAYVFVGISTGLALSLLATLAIWWREGRKRRS